MKAVDRKFKRRCVSCGVYKPKTHLIRLLYAYATSGELQAHCLFPAEVSVEKQPHHTPLGRSAYVCNVNACRHRATQQHGRPIAGVLRRPPSKTLLEQLSPQDLSY